jgi:hypothetical protein
MNEREQTQREDQLVVSELKNAGVQGEAINRIVYFFVV